jgi:hypothetical protein
MLNLKNHFIFTASLPQRLIGVLVATLIPLSFCLVLVRSHVVQPESFSTSAIFQLRFIAPSLRREPIVNSLNLLDAKVSTQRRGPAQVAKHFARPHREIAAPTLVMLNATQKAEAGMSAIVNQSAETNAANLIQQFKGKLAIGAYQDARSDIQKMADRKGVALQAERANKYEMFQTAASNAVIPDCIAQGTITKLGLDSFKGLLAIPALATAAAMGKCQ